MGSSENLLLQIGEFEAVYSAAGGARVTAVDGVRLDIHSGEVVGVLGESGCGKSTLANAILRLLPPYARQERGSIFLRGRDLLRASEPELRALRGRDVSLIPQDPALSLNPLMNVGLQIAEVLRAHLSLRATERRARVIELLREVGFDRPEDIYGAYPHQLSGGQRQRIAISQAIACRPSLLIADEPTSKLDAPLQTEIIGLLRQIRHSHGMAILMISHEPASLAGFADRIAVMYAGRIVEVGNTHDILRRPLHPYTQALIRLATSATDATAPKHFPAIEGESPDPTAFRVGCRFEARCPDRMEICARRYPQEFLPEPSRPVNCFKYGE